MPSDDDIQYVDRRRLCWTTDEESLLGQGSFGCVYRGTWDGALVAIKVIKPPARDDRTTAEEYRVAESSALKQHRREIHRFHDVHHPNIIQFFNVFRDVNPRDLYIVTEFLEGGSLHDALMKTRARSAVLDNFSFVHIANDIALGLKHVHSQRYTHGDMKPQNVLLTAGFQFQHRSSGQVFASIPSSAKAKVADFGLSKRLEGAERVGGLLDSNAATTDFGTGPCGTYLYMSPEAYKGVSLLTDAEAKAADVYAYGLILYELLTGLQSWSLERVRSPMQLHMLVRDGHRPSWGECKDFIHADCIDLVEQCWSQEPTARPTTGDIVGKLANLGETCRDQRAGTHLRSTSPSMSASTVTKPGSGDSPDVACDSDAGKAHISPANTSKEKGEQDLRGRSTDEDVVSNSFLENGRLPTITHVESLRALTDTQQEEYAQLRLRTGQAALDLTYSSDDATSIVGNVTGYTRNVSGKQGRRPRTSVGYCSSEEPVAEGPVVEPQPDIRDGFSELDQSTLGGAHVQRVDSIPIKAPEPPALAINAEVESEGKGIYGMGSVAGDVKKPSEVKRADRDLLFSFMNAACFGESSDKRDKPEPEIGKEAAKSALLKGPGSLELREEGTTLANTPETSDGAQVQIGGRAEVPGISQSGDAAETSEVPGISQPGDVAETFIRNKPENPSRSETGNRFTYRSRPFLSQARSYNSPSDVDETVLSEMMENDRMSVNHNLLFAPAKAENAASNLRPQSAVQSRPAVRQGLDEQSSIARGARHFTSDAAQQGAGFGYRTNPSCGPAQTNGHYGPHVSRYDPSMTAPSVQVMHATGQIPVASWGRQAPVDRQTVYQTLKTPDALKSITNMWKQGHMRTVASALASCPDLAGTNALEVACRMLHYCTNTLADRKDPELAGDLCTAIGNIARNDSVQIDHGAVLMTLRVALSTMFAFNQSFRQNAAGSVQVFAACNFALCNLFKVNNVIQDESVRAHLGEWIGYSISWNVFRDSEKKGPHLDTLAYTATSAARNFMWMNEDNVEAFTSGIPQENPSATARLVSSMNYFDGAQLSPPVLEASLSSLAMVIHFAPQRASFARQGYIGTLMGVLHRHDSDAKIAGLVFSMLAVLVSGPTSGQDEVEILERAFLDGGACPGIISALEKARASFGTRLELVETVQKGCFALLTAARFSEKLRAEVSDKGRSNVLWSVKWLASCQSGPRVRGRDDAFEKACVMLGVTVCELIRELAKEGSAMSFLKENGTIESLQCIAKAHGKDESFAKSCRAALETLS